MEHFDHALFASLLFAAPETWTDVLMRVGTSLVGLNTLRRTALLPLILLSTQSPRVNLYPSSMTARRKCRKIDFQKRQCRDKGQKSDFYVFISFFLSNTLHNVDNVCSRDPQNCFKVPVFLKIFFLCSP